MNGSTFLTKNTNSSLSEFDFKDEIHNSFIKEKKYLTVIAAVDVREKNTIESYKTIVSLKFFRGKDNKRNTKTSP